MNFKFEIADNSCLDELFEAEKLCFTNEYWSFSNIENELNNKRNTCIIARTNEMLSGYIFFSTVCDECELNRIAVLPNCRNLKIGKLLIEKMAENLIKTGFKKVFLEVRNSNLPAINLYLSTGFEKIGVRKNYYKNPIEDAVLMSLKIN